jgi:hypothetical protein
MIMFADAVTTPPQPPVIVYIISLVPEETPVTNPDEFTVATAGLLLLQAPVPPLRTNPLTVNVVVAPMHIGLEPVTDAIAEF